MAKKTVSRKLYIITIIVFLISAGYLGRGWRESTHDERSYATTYDMIESTFDIAFPDDVATIQSENTRGWFGDGKTLDVIVIPDADMYTFKEQIEQLGWIEYSPVMYDSLAEEYFLWGYRDNADVSFDTFTHGYLIIIGGGENSEEEKAEFIDSKGNNISTVDEALLFYNDITGRFYFFTISW